MLELYRLAATGSEDLLDISTEEMEEMINSIF